MKIVIYILLATTIIFASMYFLKPRVVIETKDVPYEVAVTDTMFIVSKPDTVYETHIRTRIDTVTATDTVYIQDSTIVSAKTWGTLYWTTGVKAYANCPVDLFELHQQIYWDRYFKDVYVPELNIKCPGSGSRSFWLGYATGTLVTAGSIYLSTKIK